MTRPGLLLLSATVACSPVVAEETGGPVIVRQAVQAAGAVIGQRVSVYVDVLFAGEMPAPPQVRLPDVPGAQVFRFESQGTTLQEHVNGNPYVGQRFEFALYARRGGSLTVPPARVTLLDRRREAVGGAMGQATALTVRVPAGVDASGPIVATARLSLDQRWEPPPAETVRVGGAVKRTVVREAEDVPALAMQDLRASTPDGVRAYADPPDTDDRSDRGTLTGRRVDRITYVFEKAGTFPLPALRQPWWDLGTQALRTSEAAGATVHVQGPSTDAASPVLDGTKSLSWPTYLLGSVLLAALIWAARNLFRWTGARRNGEPAAFRRLLRACRGTQPEPAYAALHQWRARFADTVGANRVPGDAIDAAAGSLTATLFEGGPVGVLER
ncbi:hypothetical protein [Methylobacterium tarhaniae]|uniref:hypothetical protein n=1 Tax=Methylobacterium tarhaniae TaxID=1187852 RepID=UPI003D085668